MEGFATKTARMTILHVEDSQALATLVQTAMKSLGFKGEIIFAKCIAEARTILAERSRQKAPLALILVDMQLPDGLGLEIIREVKASPSWQKTPVIVLSSETDPQVINEAYALGANCFLPKQGNGKGIIKGLQALYNCWLEEARLPGQTFAGKAQESLTTTIQVRARAARFYHNLALACHGDHELERFWIERSLMEGNKSNLLAFFQGQLSDRNMDLDLLERNIGMQLSISAALKRVEGYLATQPHPPAAEVCRWVLEILEAIDEGVLIEAFEELFPKNPAVAVTLKFYSARQVQILAEHILKHAVDSEVQSRAQAQLAFAERLSR